MSKCEAGGSERERGRGWGGEGEGDYLRTFSEFRQVKLGKETGKGRARGLPVAFDHILLTFLPPFRSDIKRLSLILSSTLCSRRQLQYGRSDERIGGNQGKDLARRRGTRHSAFGGIGGRVNHLSGTVPSLELVDRRSSRRMRRAWLSLSPTRRGLARRHH